MAFGYHPPMTALTPYCPACGYDLRGSSAAAQCPECGQAIDEDALRAAQVPWSNRARIGTTKALLRTAYRATFRTGRFCHAVGQPVDYADARKFQRTVVGLVWFIPLAAFGFIVFTLTHDDRSEYPWLETLGLGPSLALGVAFALGWYLFLLLGTGVHTYWFHPRTISTEQQNRAVALSYYACAPLFWTIPVVLLMLVGFVLVEIGNTVRNDTLFLVGMLTTLAAAIGIAGMAVGYVMVCFQMAGRVAHRGLLGRFILLSTQPLLLILLACFTVLGLPAAVGYVWLIAITW
jgi:hypothetical protein